MPDHEVESARFDVPKSPKRYIYEMTNLLGCDFTSSPSAVDDMHSADCINMIRYMPGKIRKRMGYTEVINANYTGALYNIWCWDQDHYLVQQEMRLYLIGRDANGAFDWSVLKTQTDTAYSRRVKGDYTQGGVDYYNQDIILGTSLYSCPLNYRRCGDKAIIYGAYSYTSGGQESFEYAIYFFDGTKLTTTDHANKDLYWPTVTMQKAPQGGGTSYEPFNLLSPWFSESFYVSADDATETEFHMSYDNLEAVECIYVLDANGVDWNEVTAYTADLQTGYITFTTAPGASPVEGEDNVIITVKKTFSGYRERIANCTISFAYGVGGNNDRVFMSGNPDYPNYDWYSDYNELCYFPDTNYSVLGAASSPITGYAIVSNYLVTYKGASVDDQTVIIRQGTLDEDGNAVFQIVKSLQGPPIIAPKSCAIAGTEPMVLTNQGVYAITPNDINGDEILNLRSYYLNGKLLKEQFLDNVEAIRFGDYYVLFVYQYDEGHKHWGGNYTHIYILDTLQPITIKEAPYSTRQYAGFFFEIRTRDVKCPIVIDNELYFVNSNRIYKFNSDENDITAYNDDGTAIYCRFDTADMDDKIFFKNKTYRYFALRLFSSIVSSVKLYAYRMGEWELIKHDNTTAREFSFSQLVFSKLTFRTDKGTRLINTKMRIKKADHVKFRIENGEVNEPLFIDQIGIEYTQSGNYKN